MKESHRSLCDIIYITKTIYTVNLLLATFMSEAMNLICVEIHNGANMHIFSTREAAGFYFEYSIVNHMCRPNCEFKNEKCNAALYALQDIEPGSQLGISYLQS